MRNKKIKSFIGAVVISCMAITTSYAASSWESYDTTYEMYRNVNTKIHKVITGYKVNIEPIKGTWNSDMYIYKYEDTFWGKRGTDLLTSTSSDQKSNITINGSGKYGLTFYNPTGNLWTGRMTISFK